MLTFFNCLFYSSWKVGITPLCNIILSLGGMIPIRSLIVIESYIFKLLYLGYNLMFSFEEEPTYLREKKIYPWPHSQLVFSWY